MQNVDPINGWARAMRARLRHSNQYQVEAPLSDGIIAFFTGLGAPYANWQYVAGWDQSLSLTGSTTEHAVARVIHPAFFGQFNGQRWYAAQGDGWREKSSRVCCIGSINVGDSQSTSDSVLGAINRYEQLAESGIYIAKKQFRSGLVLCGEASETVLSPPWIVFTTGFAGNAISPDAQYARNSDSAFFPSLSGTWPDMTVLAITSNDGNAENATRIFASGSERKLRAVLGFSHATSRYFATLCFDRFVFSVSRNRGNNSSNFGLSPTPPGFDSAESWRNNRLEVFSICFATISQQVPQALAERRDAGVIPSSNYSLLCGGIENVDPSAMVSDETPYDYAQTVVSSFVSGSVQRWNFNTQSFQNSDATFENPEFRVLNSESQLGLGNTSARLPNSETHPVRASRTFLKNDQVPQGNLADEPISFVMLRSAKMARFAAPVDDADVTFPVVTAAQQSTFRFRGKSITGAGVRFSPWSSNTFSGAIDAEGATQKVQPTQIDPPALAANLNTTHEYREGSQVSEDYSGTYVRRDDVIKFESAGAPLGSVSRFYNYEWLLLWPFLSSPSLRADYHPNQQWDEQSYLAGVVAGVLGGTARLGEARYNTGKIREGENAQLSQFGGYLGFSYGQMDGRHPEGWTDSLSNLASAAQVRRAASVSFLPSLAGKEFVCNSSSVAGVPWQAGLFHCIDDGVAFQKSATRNFSGLREVATYTSIQTVTFPNQRKAIQTTGQTIQSSWLGSVVHRCSFATPTVEIFVQWSASLQSPGPYKVRPPFPSPNQGLDLDREASTVAPSMFVRTTDLAQVTPVLVAEVWVRAVGECDVASDYTFPELFQNSGTYSHKVRVFSVSGGQVNTQVLKDFSDSQFVPSAWADDSPVATASVSFRKLGAFPFNRAQTQRLLDGETVTPTYWFLDDEGTALESQPVTVPWHNDTFGTYKLEFRLVTD
jgi:hypothetical protein